MALGDRIKGRREELRYTQEQLAQKAGISKGFLSDLENGKRGIGADTLLDLARALGQSLDFLMTGEEGEYEVDEVEIPTPLAEFAGDAGLGFRQALMLLDMQRQIIAHRRDNPVKGLSKVDWRKFYEAVKEFL